MYLHDHQTTTSQGRGFESALGSPPMHPRCKALELAIPGTRQELEDAVKRWIATCVQSRTQIGGVAVHRERGLVDGNASLLDIWNRILRHRVGQKVLITAEYIWGPNRVETIRFSTTATPPPPPPVPPPSVRPPPPFNAAACRTFCDENKVCCGNRSRMPLQCQGRWQTCRENCDRGRVWRFLDTDCQRSSPPSFLGEPVASGPVFRFDCPPGCPPATADRCRAIVRRAIIDAIALANGAASKLEATPRDAETIRLFRAFFGHDPSRPVPWAGNKQSGLVVAHRFRKCAEELGGGRNIMFRCITGCPATTNARTNAAQDPSLIRLCPRFFNRPAGLPLNNQFFRAGVILHEMLHLLYYDFFHHPGHPSGDPVRRRDNAHCYEAFALRVAGHAAERGDVRACRNQLA